MDTTNQPYLPGDDLLWRQLKTIPAFRAILRAVEARFYHQVDLPEPLLDIGCGDGHFAQMTFDHVLTAGIDPWWGPLQKARRSGQYQQVLQSMGDDLPFPDHSFASAISNSVLEHIPDVQPVLNEISRVLQPGGLLVITMPSHNFTQNLGGAALLTSLGLPDLADRYRRFFNFISRHAHTDTAEAWAARLAEAGFRVERWQYYFSTRALRALEWGHVQGLPAAILHALTGHWIVAPWESSLQRTNRWLRPFYEEEAPVDGAYVLFIARKAADEPIEATLPAARPFTVAEMEEAVLSTTRAPSPAAQDEETDAVDTDMETAVLPASSDVLPSTTPTAPLAVPLIPYYFRSVLASLTLLFALIGQLRLSDNPEVPGDGIRWFLASGISLFLLVGPWRNLHLPAWQLPHPGKIPRQRWLYFAALFLVLFLGQSLVNTSGGQLPFLAIFIWLSAIAIAFYALNGHTADPHASVTHRSFSASLPIAIVVFGAALLPRALNLTGLPFILNGTEASLGLDIVQIVQGNLRHPFAVGWMTNPTLPLFLMALPVKLFGPSAFSLRLLSPVIGALTVALTFWFGQRLWNQMVGIVAAILLGGMHLHVHYSRMGLTNIWDPMLVLLALGLLALAWQETDLAQQRRRWLWAGTAVGFNAYFFTSSHLLPLMLVGLLIWALIFERHTLWQQGRHILSAVALAFLIALPLLLFYNNYPQLFLERARALGILAGQSDWLHQEALRTGLSQGTVFRHQFWQAMLAFNGSLDHSPSYRPMASLLSFGPALFFALGLLLALLSLRQLRHAMLLVWVLATLFFAGVLLQDPPQSHRLLLAAPALALLAATSLTTLGQILAARIGEKREETAVSRSLMTIVLVIAILLAANDLIFYFGRFSHQNSFADRNTEIAQRMADYLNTLDDSWTAYFYGPPSMYVSFPTIPFLVTDFQANVNLFDVPPAPNDAVPTAPTPNQVYIYLPERQTELLTTQSLLPGGEIRSFSGVYANPLFYVYEIRP